MSIQRGEKLNSLQHLLPEGMVVDTAWLVKKGYSRALLSKYLAAGWLNQPSRGLYRRPGARSAWQHVIISLQMLMRQPISVGGLTALEEQGLGHYVRKRQQHDVHLYCEEKAPTWMGRVDPLVRYRTHNGRRLFNGNDIAKSINALTKPLNEVSWQNIDVAEIPIGLRAQRWGDRQWPIVMSSPERAIIEFLDELPSRQSFEHADDLFSGLTTLSPKRLQVLLEACRSVKAKRLFLWFAERYTHPWYKHLNLSKIDVGSGKRVVIKGGRLDTKYLITVPENLHGSR